MYLIFPPSIFPPVVFSVSVTFCFMLLHAKTLAYSFIPCSPFSPLDPNSSFSCCEQEDPTYFAIWGDNKAFNEVIISPAMLHEHLPYVVMEGLNKVMLKIGIRGRGGVTQFNSVDFGLNVWKAWVWAGKAWHDDAVEVSCRHEMSTEPKFCVCAGEPGIPLVGFELIHS